MLRVTACRGCQADLQHELASTTSIASEARQRVQSVEANCAAQVRVGVWCLLLHARVNALSPLLLLTPGLACCAASLLFWLCRLQISSLHQALSALQAHLGLAPPVLPHYLPATPGVVYGAPPPPPPPQAATAANGYPHMHMQAGVQHHPMGGVTQVSSVHAGGGGMVQPQQQGQPTFAERSVVPPAARQQYPQATGGMSARSATSHPPQAAQPVSEQPPVSGQPPVSSFVSDARSALSMLNNVAAATMAAPPVASTGNMGTATTGDSRASAVASGTSAPSALPTKPQLLPPSTVPLSPAAVSAHQPSSGVAGPANAVGSPKPVAQRSQIA